MRLALDQQLKLQYDSVIATLDYEGRAGLAVSAVLAEPIARHAPGDVVAIDVLEAVTVGLPQKAGSVRQQGAAAAAHDHVMLQAQVWQQDPYLRELRSIYRREQTVNPISQDWLLDTSPALEFH